MAADPSHSRRGTQWLTWGLLVSVFAGGAAWRQLRTDVDAKLPAERFVTDSIRRDAANDALRKDMRALLDAMNETNSRVNETNGRLREIVCAGRAGCR